ncbi:hypothetical protein AU255_12815 [Methyloprofundus sedimenti]|uniref:Uncharacterized protein n=1 Tax=Methyloprofundus sedimenti TaxID=1420851 RepID=A0A1V8M358_9GAMM|nr:hypothetical protein [Methyloprofundus sedimenti]OQK15997.1 hypothetical protein AU255_12815 [Methyloprofundus sedimenti]
MDFKTLMLNWERRFDREVIDRFRDGLLAYANDREKEVGAEYAKEEQVKREDEFEHQSYLTFLEDEASFLGEIIALGDELAIIALYKKIELTRKRILKRSFPSLNEKKLSDFDYIKGTLLFFDIDQIDGASGADELRLINNSIKHQGKVSRPLAAKYQGWVEGEELRELGKVYKRLAPESEKYIASLVDAINAHHTNIT